MKNLMKIMKYLLKTEVNNNVFILFCYSDQRGIVYCYGYFAISGIVLSHLDLFLFDSLNCKMKKVFNKIIHWLPKPCYKI